MALPVASNIHINYDTEKGEIAVFQVMTKILTCVADRIRDFLSKFKGSQEKDLERNFANIDIRDDNGAGREESTSLKYMQQLVRVITRSD